MRFVMMMPHTWQGGAGGIHAQGPFQRPGGLRSGSQAQACRRTDVRAHAAYNPLLLVAFFSALSHNAFALPRSCRAWASYRRHAVLMLY